MKLKTACNFCRRMIRNKIHDLYCNNNREATRLLVAIKNPWGWDHKSNTGGSRVPPQTAGVAIICVLYIHIRRTTG